jgi:hypothetical protein
VTTIRTVALISATVAVIAGGVAALALLPSGDGGRYASEPRVMTSQAFYVWGDTPRDWVSWADQIAVVDVLGEEQVPYEPGQFEGDSGWVARRIHARIAETIWIRPGSSAAPPSVKLATTDGWWYSEGELTPIKDLGAHRVEVGDRLLVAMMRSEKWGWTLMSGGVPVDAAVRLHADHDQTGIGKQLNGMALPQLRNTFRSARPFADVVRFHHLDIEERMIAVYKYGRDQAASRDG